MIKKIVIGKIRAFDDMQSLSFPDAPAESGRNKLSLLVGPNNSGKSSILTTIEDLTTEGDVFTLGKEHRHGDDVPVIEVYHSEGEVRILRASGSKFAINGNIDQFRRLLRHVPSRRPWSETFNSSFNIEGYRGSVRASRRNTRTFFDTNFAGALMALTLNPDQKQKFNELLRSIDPSISDWKTETVGNQDFIEYSSETKRWHRIGDVGDGVSSLFRICYELIHLKPEDTLLIDEPELSLHPQVQKNLAHQILAYSKIAQIIVATHSPHFISWQALNEGTQVFRLNMTNTGAKVSLLSESTLDRILRVAKTDRRNLMLYDAVAKEIFFSKGTLFVEGTEDSNIIRSFIEQTGRSQIEIFGYGSGGASHIPDWLQMCCELGIKAVGLFDGDTEGSKHFEFAKEKFANQNLVKIYKLWAEDIRDKSNRDNNAHKKGVFNSDWTIKDAQKQRFENLLHEIETHLSEPAINS